MLGVGFGYPCAIYVLCRFAFRASADEEIEMPRTQTNNPSRTDVFLMVARGMEFLHRCCRRSQPKSVYHSGLIPILADPDSCCVPPRQDVHCKNVRRSSGIQAPCSSA